MKEINLQRCHNKKAAIKLCEENGTTIKEVIIENINTIIDGLKDNILKIQNNEKLENEDWVKVAIPLNSMMTALANGWYLEY